MFLRHYCATIVLSLPPLSHSYTNRHTYTKAHIHKWTRSMKFKICKGSVILFFCFTLGGFIQRALENQRPMIYTQPDGNMMVWAQAMTIKLRCWLHFTHGNSSRELYGCYHSDPRSDLCFSPLCYLLPLHPL